jgi:tRNA threonylcarbamoyladenosine biosynthesis protein TsaE
MSGPLHGPGQPAGPRVRLDEDTRAALRVYPITLPSAADTFDLGRRLARLLRPGDLLVLTGPLGAGKTVLAQGIGAGLGVSGDVVSPTFVIARTHPGPLPLVHVDAYRLGSLAEIDDLDLDVEAADSVTVVEWGRGVAEQLSDARLEIVISRGPDTEQRSVQLLPHGGDWTQRIAELG